MAQMATIYLVYFWKKIRRQDFPKIVKSGHTFDGATTVISTTPSTH